MRLDGVGRGTCFLKRHPLYDNATPYSHFHERGTQRSSFKEVWLRGRGNCQTRSYITWNHFLLAGKEPKPWGGTLTAPCCAGPRHCRRPSSLRRKSRSRRLGRGLCGPRMSRSGSGLTRRPLSEGLRSREGELVSKRPRDGPLSTSPDWGHLGFVVVSCQEVETVTG